MSEHATPSAIPGGDRIEISVPLRTDYLATLRTMAAALGADAGFSIDEIDDMRLAISEVVSSLVDAAESDGAVDAHAERLDAIFEVANAGIIVSISARDGVTDVELDELASGILGSVVDRHDIVGGTVTLVKRPAEAAESRAGGGSDSDHPSQPGA